MKALVMKCLLMSVLVNVSFCSEEYKYKLIDSQERPRRSDSSGPGPYLQKDSFFSSGFLEGLFGFGRPEPSMQVKRENTAQSRYPYHGQPFGPSSPQNNQYNPYIAPSPIPHDPQPFHRPFYTGVPINPQKPTIPSKLINPTLNPYTYKVTAATIRSLTNPESQNFPFQPVFPAYGYNTTPYPSTPPPTKSNIESQDHSALKPHHDFSSSSSPQYENPEPKLDQFFTIKPFVHKVKPFVHKEKPESTINVINKPESVGPVALIQHPQPINYNVIQDRPYSTSQQNFPNAGYSAQSSMPYIKQNNFAEKNKYINPTQKKTQSGPSMESLLAKIDINSLIQKQNAVPEVHSNFNNVHTPFSNALQSNLIAQQSDAHTKHQFKEPQNHINPPMQQMTQIPHKMTAISKPEQFFMPNIVQEDSSYQNVHRQNIQSPMDIHNNQVNVPEHSFDVFHQNSKPANKKQPQSSFHQPLQPLKVSLKTVQHVKKTSPYSYSLLPGSKSSNPSSFHQVPLPKIQQKTNISPQNNFHQNPDMQSFVHDAPPLNPIRFHPFVDQTSVKNKSPPQTFPAIPQMSLTNDQSNQKQFTHRIQSVNQAGLQPVKTFDQSQNFQSFDVPNNPAFNQPIDNSFDVPNNPVFQPAMEKSFNVPNNPIFQQAIAENMNNKPTQKPFIVKNLPSHVVIPKEAKAQIGPKPKFVINANEQPIQNILNHQYPTVFNQSPIHVSPNTNNEQLSNTPQTEKLFPSPTTPPAASVHLGTSINREMVKNPVKISGPSRKPRPQSNIVSAYKDELIQVNSVIKSNTDKDSVKSNFQEVKSEAVDSTIENNNRKYLSVSQTSVPNNIIKDAKIEKSFEKTESKNEQFTSFPSRGKPRIHVPREKSVAEKKKKLQTVVKPKIKKKSNQTRRKVMNVKEKEVNKENSLQKLLAIAGAGWDTTETIEKSIKSAKSKFKCPKPEGHFADPGRCEVYYRCVHGTSTQLQCGAGLKWNSKTNQCDWGDNVDCGLNRVPRSKDSVGDKK